MRTWAAVCEGLLLAIVLMHAATRLWPKRAGCHYLRYELSRRGIRIEEIPPGCIREFVDDAHDYARSVGTPRRVPHFEFERMLRVHSFVMHAVLTGRTAGQVHAVETIKAADRAVVQELIRSEMLRAGVDPSGDAAECQRIENECRAGKSWERHRTILGRYELPAPISQNAIGELTQ